ncbi:MAG: pyridoxal phosphate-dependent aminotransferase [Propionibacteriaceae bacterium]
MTEYRQSSKLQGVRYDVRGPNLVEAMRMEAAGEKILKLNIGNPAPFDFEAPDLLLQEMIHHLPQAQGYSDSRGVLPAREAVSDYYKSEGLDVSVDDVLIGNGVSELIGLVLQSLIEGGDEILIPAPDYPLWTASATLYGGKAVHYLCDEENGWNPDLEDIRSKVTDRTKAIVIINPNNPTGAVYSRETIQGIVDIAREHNLILLSDEIYEKICFNGSEMVHTATLAGDDVLCFTYSGLSKAYRVCGYRAGWVAVTGPKHLAKDLLDGLTLLANMRLCSNVPAQYTIPIALKEDKTIEDLIIPGGRLYEQLTLSHRLLTEIPGVTCQPARGSLYLFPRLDPTMYKIEDDEQWCLELLKTKKILVSHGRGFNWPTPDHFRLVALPDTDMITEALGRVAEFCEEKRS